MKYSFAVICLIPFFTISACTSLHEINGSVQPHPNHDDLYLVYFRYSPFIEKYTDGWDALRADVAKQKNINDKLAVWQNAISVAMPIYLSNNNMIPNECANGIKVISSNSDEGGGGVAAIKCND